MDSPVDQRFGRARFFILVHLDTGDWSAHDNRQSLETPREAGIQAAQRVVKLGAHAVITGHCGPRAYTTLDNAGIAVYQDAEGTVRDALNAYETGQLEKAGAANVDAGFGDVDTSNH